MARLDSPHSLVFLAWLNVVLHGTGLAFLIGGIGPGSSLVDLPARVRYVGQSPWGWTCGWGVWMLCALALIALFAALERHLPDPPGLARLAVMLAVAGGAVDLFCDVIQISVLPLIASAGSTSEILFQTAERMAGAGGLIVANGLYCLATLMLTFALRACLPQAHWATKLGLAVFGFGMLMVAAGFTDQTRLAAVASGLTIGLYCLWTLAVARALERSGDNA